MDKQSTGLIIFFIVILGGILFWSKNKPPAKISEPERNQQVTQNQGVEESTISPEGSEGTENDIMTNKKTYTNPPEILIDSQGEYSAILHTTQGDITISLNVSSTPITANNFYFLAKEGFYNNTIFHRTIEGFMIQGGDPTGTGAGGPGYRFDDEPFEGDYERGVVAMANAGADTNGSQFFIMHKSYELPKNYVIFGQVTDGMDVVDTIATAPKEASPSGEISKPVNPVTITSVDIVE